MRTTVATVVSLMAISPVWALDVVDFEGPPAGTIITTVPSAIGDIAVGGAPNPAIIFDTTSPPADPDVIGGIIDADLGSPNSACDVAGPGVGVGGEPGSDFANCLPVAPGNVLIIASDLIDDDSDGLVDVPNDLRTTSASFTFEFPAPVSVLGLTLVDIDLDEGIPSVELYGAEGALLGIHLLGRTGNNGVGAFELEENGGVWAMVVRFYGSGAIDDLHIATCSQPCDDDDPCTEDFCNPQNGQCIHQPIECPSDDPCHTYACVDGGCAIVDSVVCITDNPCVQEACNPQTGQCEVTGATPCDDNDPCTRDSCDSQDGTCIHDPIECESDDLCNYEECVDGQCMVVESVVCDDHACFESTCNPQTGECEVTGEVDCDDNDECTEDYCDVELGECVHIDLCQAECGTSAEAAGQFLNNVYSLFGFVTSPATGSWHHTEDGGSLGPFTFIASPEAYAPYTGILSVSCSDTPACGEGFGYKQVDFEGIGIMWFDRIVAGVTPVELNYFRVHTEDLDGALDGRPRLQQSRRPRGTTPAQRHVRGGGPVETCPLAGHDGLEADCTCGDYYRITIYTPFQPGSDPNTTDVIYEVYGYITNGGILHFVAP